MSANVETMFYTREKPWHGLGTRVEEAPNSADALKLAGLDWNVKSESVFDGRGIPISGYKANVRESDETVLGIVGEKYTIVQNVDAFAFTDSIIGGDVRYETAGSLREGRQVWLLAKMPTEKLAGDDTDPYLCFTNSHDGTGAVRVCMTPVRVVCNNTLNLALQTAKRTWAMRHTESIASRLDEAKDCLMLARKYMGGLSEYAEAAKKKQVSDEKLKEFLDELFPLGVSADAPEAKVEKAKERQKKLHDEYMICYWMPDLAAFRGTAWGAINAAADFAAHTPPRRKTTNYKENNFSRIIVGHTLVDSMANLCMAGAK